MAPLNSNARKNMARLAMMIHIPSDPSGNMKKSELIRSG